VSPFDWMSGRVFNLVHQHQLVYNTCWEDPKLDRQALELRPTDNVLVITSAGCNALDYALAGAARVDAVDINPRQNALLELKLAGIRALEFDDFFSMFGCGRLDRADEIYRSRLRPLLSPWSQTYWDRNIRFFAAGNRRSFYFRGTSGAFAWLMNVYIDRVARLRPWVDSLLAAPTIDVQRAIYDDYLCQRFWSRSMKFFMNRNAVLSLVGVPPAQRRQVETQYDGGILEFMHDCVEAVFARLPVADNYFWRVYLQGQYTPDCCPEYLKAENFQRLKAGLVDRVRVSTDSVTGFLEKNDVVVSRFVLLDHMDWLAYKLLPALEEEWQWILRRAAPDARVIWRSGGLRTDFVDRLRVSAGGRQRELGELLTYHRQRARELHQRCRVHTYGSFHIADLAA
jgi:S-adenosylmethionine-diacylglycerol 3-amino-3-carboxypropyl transferase